MSLASYRVPNPPTSYGNLSSDGLNSSGLRSRSDCGAEEAQAGAGLCSPGRGTGAYVASEVNYLSVHQYRAHCINAYMHTCLVLELLSTFRHKDCLSLHNLKEALRRLDGKVRELATHGSRSTTGSPFSSLPPCLLVFQRSQVWIPVLTSTAAQFSRRQS